MKSCVDEVMREGGAAYVVIWQCEEMQTIDTFDSLIRNEKITKGCLRTKRLKN